jgi:hypothetical protein
VTLRPAFERFAIDPSNLLLALDREGLGTLLGGWLDSDAWINAPLDRGLPPLASTAAMPAAPARLATP